MKYLKIPLLLLAFTPLIFYDGAIFPFIFPKTLFIRAMITLFWIGLAALLLHQLYQLYKRQSSSGNISVNQLVISVNQRLRSPIFLAVVAFMLLASISTIFAENPYRAFWGDVERGKGLVGLLFFFGFFVGALWLFAERDWKKFFVFTLIPATILFIDQILIFLTRQSLFINISPVEFETGRALGTLVGNPAFLSAFYIFAIFAAAMLLASRPLVTAKHQRESVSSYPHESAKIRINPRVDNQRKSVLDNKPVFAEKLRRIGLIVFVFAAVTGIFIGGTRGAILGLAVGSAVTAMFIILRRDFSQTARRAAFAGMAIAIFSGSVFVATRDAPLWDNIPGFARIAGISLEDPTFQTRLIATSIGINAVNPQNEGVFRALVGWGPENFSVAYQKYFDPRYFRYEALWFDRAHNKLIDVLVMNGLLGLISYLTLWGLVFYFILKSPKSRNNAKPYAEQRGNEPLERAALLFFGAAYFTQNLFVFENISVYIPFFAFLGFLASRGTRISADNKLISADNKLISADDQKLITADANQRKSAINQRKSVLLAAAASIAALFFAAALAATLIAFGQMRAYTIPFLAGRADQIVANFDRIAKPYTYIQPELRSLFSQTIFGGLAEENINAIRPFLTMAAEAMKEAAERERTSARYFLFTASAYGALGDLEQAKKHQRRALELAPRRQDVLYAIALSGAKAGNKETALYYAEKMRGLDPEAMISRIHYAVVLALTQGAASFKESAGLMLSVFEGPRPFRQVSGEISVARQVFDFYIMEFYLARDSEQFLKALQKLKLFEERYDVSVRFHSPDAPPSEQIPKIQRRIDVFIAEGWEGVQF